MASNLTSILGYHGTFEENAQDIIDNGFTPKRRENHWLGQGTYFYDSIDLAHWFITVNSKTDLEKKQKKQVIVLIKATIVAKKEEILDLDSPEGVDYLYEKFASISSNLGAIKFGRDEHQNLCFIIDVLAAYFGLKVIIKTFEKPNPSYGKVDTAVFDMIIPINVKYKERQICVRDNLCIKNKIVEYPNSKYVKPQKLKMNYKIGGI